MEFTLNHEAVKNLPEPARRDWAVAATVGGSEKAGWEYLKKAGWSKEAHRWSLKKTEQTGEKFNAPVRLAKAEKEGEEMYVTLVASGFGVDKQNDQMEKSAITRMIDTCKMGTVGMRESHSTTFPMAKSVDAYMNQDNEMEVKMKLDKAHPYSGYLFDRVAKGEAVEQASVYGFVTSKDYVWNPSVKKMVKSIKDVALSFIDLTPAGESAFPGAGFVEAIAKQVSWETAPKAPSLEGSGKGETMEELLKQLEGMADAMEKSMASEFKIEAHMLDKEGSLRKEFKGELEKSRKTLSAEDVTLLSKSVERILNAAGIETVEVQDAGAVSAVPMRKSKVMKKLAKALGVDKATLKKALSGLEMEETPAVDPALETLQKQIVEQGEILKKIAAAEGKGRPAVPGSATLISKQAAADQALTLNELTPLMKSVGEAAKTGMLTGDGMANAKALSSKFVRQVAELAMGQSLASVGQGLNPPESAQKFVTAKA